MSKVIPNIFTTHELTEQEAIVGSSYNEEQLKFLQNYLAVAAMSKLNVKPDPNNYADYIQQEAYARGQIDVIQYLLDNHEAAQEQLLVLAQQQPQ